MWSAIVFGPDGSLASGDWLDAIRCYFCVYVIETVHHDFYWTWLYLELIPIPNVGGGVMSHYRWIGEVSSEFQLVIDYEPEPIWIEYMRRQKLDSDADKRHWIEMFQ